MALNEDIHDELVAAAGPLPAAYIETKAFARVTQARLIDAVKLLAGKVLPAGSGALSARLDPASIAAAQALTLELSPPVTPTQNELDIVLTPSLSANVEIFISSDPNKVISELSIAFHDIRIHLRAQSNSLILEGADFRTQRSITRSVDADQYLADAGVDPLEAARIEGHLAYGVVSQAASLSLVKRTEWPLSVLFPAVDFGTSVQLIRLANGAALGIVPTADVTLITSSRCTCADNGGLQHSTTTIVATAPADPQPNDEFGKVTLGGPLPDGKDPLKDFGPRYLVAARRGFTSLVHLRRR